MPPYGDQTDVRKATPDYDIFGTVKVNQRRWRTYGVLATKQCINSAKNVLPTPDAPVNAHVVRGDKAPLRGLFLPHHGTTVVSDKSGKRIIICIFFFLGNKLATE